jgi:hypothetical protein
MGCLEVCTWLTMAWKRKQKKDVNYVVLIGAILTLIIGWIISSTDRFTFKYYILAPHYLDAKAGLAKLQEKDAILTEEDTGFFEIAELLKENLTGNGIPIITQVKTVDYGIRTVDIPHSGMENREYLEAVLKVS